jgi:hypothetical protein
MENRFNAKQRRWICIDPACPSEKIYYTTAEVMALVSTAKSELAESDINRS